jgi:hypothetical protein
MGDFVVIPFKDFHFYKVQSLLHKWQYVVISDFVADERFEMPRHSDTQDMYFQRCVKEMIDSEVEKGYRCPVDGFYLKDFFQDRFTTWLLWPLKNKRKPYIVIGMSTSPNGSDISTTTVEEMFINGPNHYMEIEITTDDAYALSPLGTDDVIPTQIYTSFANLFKGNK